MLSLGIDLGGTGFPIGIIDAKTGEIIAEEYYKLSAGMSTDSIVREVVAAVRPLLAAYPDVKYAGVCSPGVITPDGTTVIRANNLPFEHLPLGEVLTEQLGVRFWLANDGNAAGFGEQLFGGAHGRKNAIVLMLGTGIGGGIVINDKIYVGKGVAGEVGHIIIHKGGRYCSCKQSGCFEAYASATGLVTTTRIAMHAHRQDSLLWQTVKTPEDVDGRTAFLAMDRGDEVASRVIKEYVEDLATGMASLDMVLDPEVFCLGGGIANEGQRLLDLVTPVFRKMVSYKEEGLTKTEITLAQLGDKAGLIGAAMLFQQYQ